MSFQFKDIIESAKVIIICISKEFQITEFNQEAEFFYGKKSKDVIGKDFLTLLIPETYQKPIKEILGEVINGRNDLDYEIPLRSISGKKNVIKWNFSALKVNNNQIIGVVGIGQDISHLKIKEKNLRESEKIFKNFLQNFQGIAYQAYLDTFIPRLFIGNVKEITGYTYEEFIDQKVRWDMIIHPDDLLKVKEESKNLIDDPNYIADNEYRIFQKNGELKWVNDISRNIFSTDSKERIIQGSIFDITERKKIEKELESQNAVIESIFKAAPTGIGRVINRVLTDVNDRFCDLVGYSREELLGKSARMVYPTDEDYEYVGKEKYNQINRDGIGTVETRFKRKNGEIIDILLSSSPLDIKDHSKGVTFTALDITTRKKIEIELKKSEERYRMAYNRAEFYKDLFAHDINNILHNILMGIQLNSTKLKKLTNIEKIQEINEIIKEQVNRGAKLVSNIKKISQIEEEQIPLKQIEIMTILNNSIIFVKKTFQYKSLIIQYETELKEIYINANEFIQEIFDNILINAIKYTEKPEVEVKIKISKELIESKNYIKMQFIDNGIGIPNSIKNTIFVRTYHKSDNTGGMGLGLSLVKKIVESYGGDIWVEDKIKGDSSQGSNFIVLLPELT